MLGLDTNVLVRFLVRDHEAQFERARRLIKREVGAQEKVLISLLVLLETEWVLRSRYGLQKNQIMDAISGLLDAAELELEDEPTIEEALYLWKDSAADFADCLIGARHRRLGCRGTATFDVRAVKLPGFVAG
jgi:predicted nucleic-acid-binding protein